MHIGPGHTGPEHTGPERTGPGRIRPGNIRPGNIRPAGLADLPRISAVCEASLSLEPDAAELPGLLLADAARTRVALVAESAGTVVGVACGSLRHDFPDAPITGYLDLLAVVPPARRLGIGRALLGAAERELATQGAARFRIAGNPPVYLWPGVDTRYAAMIALARTAGYQQYGEALNLTVDLTTDQTRGQTTDQTQGQTTDQTQGQTTNQTQGQTTNQTQGQTTNQTQGQTTDQTAGRPGRDRLSTQAEERRLAADGITVRRASARDAQPLSGWLGQGPWGKSAWPDEAARSLERDPPGCHIAERVGDYLAFACHGANRRGWFGPMGTLDSQQRRGIGAVLLKRCLADIRDAGLDSAQIGWAGPVQFYEHAVGARQDRVFRLYRKDG